ncbi:MAG: PilZ domain-containing protein [Phycisphaerales bacterium]
MQVAELTQDLTFRTDHDRRRHRRYAVRPMYSLIRIQTESGELIDGHIHDLAVGGVRFECDVPLPEGSRVRFEIELPGGAATLHGWASIIRIADEDTRTGTMVLAAAFERFDTRIESGTLTRYLEQGCLLRSA